MDDMYNKKLSFCHTVRRYRLQTWRLALQKYRDWDEIRKGVCLAERDYKGVRRMYLCIKLVECGL